MDELRRALDNEARGVGADPGALQAIRRRAARRRVTRQVGTGAVALAVAVGGFALALSAFSGPGSGRPMVGPTATVSPGATLVVVAAPEPLRSQAQSLAARLAEAGYTVEMRPLAPDEVPSHTAVAYAVDLRDQAWDIIRRFLPGVSLTGSGHPGSRPPIEIRLAPSDYPAVTVRVRLLDGSGLEGASDAAATILNDSGYALVELGDAGNQYSETFITCGPEDEAAGQRVRETLFPKAEIRPQLPADDHDVTVHIGRDFYDDYAGLSP
jgi:hypothetical protein